MGILRLFPRHIDIGLGRQVVLTKLLADKGAGIIKRHIRKACGVGSHIGNQTCCPMTAQLDTFIELLCEHHGLAGGKAQFAGSILL